MDLDLRRWVVIQSLTLLAAEGTDNDYHIQLHVPTLLCFARYWIRALMQVLVIQ